MIGCLQVGYEIVKYLLLAGIKIDYFITISKEKAAEQKVSGFIDYLDLANEHGIPVYIVEKYSMKSVSDRTFFEQNRFDLLIQGGWQRLFPEEILKTLHFGAIGIHGSSDFLPKGRGRSPINWSLIQGKKRFIMQYFIMKPGADDGDIFHYETFDINEWDDCNTLYYKNAIVSKKVLLEYIPKILASDYLIVPQKGTPSYYPKRTAEDGIINWSNDVFSIYDFIRALTKPYPGAYGFIENHKIIIWKAQPFDTRITYSNCVEGQVVETFKNNDIVINCNSGLLLITNYDYAGKIHVNQIISAC